MTRAVVVLAMLAAVPAFADPPRGSDMTGKKELRMANCPAAVAGASTDVANLPNGVIVTVRAPDDPIAAEEIRRRVRFQLEIVDQPERGAIEHTGVGTGSGRYGHCPGMLEETKFDVQWLSDGARMFVRADGPAEIARLQKSTRKRVAALAAHKRAPEPKHE